MSKRSMHGIRGVARRRLSLRGSQALGLLLAVPAFIAAALVGLLYLHDPPGRDQGISAYIGWRWLAGEVPYLDAGLEPKGPLPFAAYGLALGLFGHTMSAIRLLAWIATLAASLGVTWIATRLSGRILSGVIAGAAYLLFVSASGLGAYGHGAVTEAFMEPLVVAAMAAALLAAGTWEPGRARSRPPRRAGLWFLAGAFLGAAALGKPFVLCLAIALVAAFSRLDMLTMAALGAGLFTPWAAALMYFAQQGAGGTFLDQIFTYQLANGGAAWRQLGSAIPFFLLGFGKLLDIRFLALALPGLWFAATTWRQPATRLLLGWALLTIVTVLGQGPESLNHFYSIMAPLAVLIGLGIACLGEIVFAVASARATQPGHRAHTASPPLRALALLIMSIGFAGFAGLGWDQASHRLRYALGTIPEDEFLAHFAPYRAVGEIDPQETVRASAWVEENLGADETLLMWGYEPGINFLAQRRSPTRFICNDDLTSTDSSPASRARAWQLFWEDLSHESPDWIVIEHAGAGDADSSGENSELERAPDFKAYVETNYRPEVRTGAFEFLRRTTGEGGLRALAAERAVAIQRLDPAGLGESAGVIRPAAELQPETIPAPVEAGLLRTPSTN
jgi:hypothetical protein